MPNAHAQEGVDREPAGPAALMDTAQTTGVSS